ncbi:hypothetical protein NVV43_30595, partial [Escherichia marmotae]|nr:hypothetical protein [Escherichia marmotae]
KLEFTVGEFRELATLLREVQRTDLALALAALWLWCSFHPSQVSIEVFRNQVLAIKDAGIDGSVGAVASVTDYDTLQWLR